MKVLVTGGDGFIGRHIVEALRARGDHVDILDLPEADIRSTRDVHVCIHSVQPDAIVHLAANLSVMESILYPDADARANVLGTVNVLEAARSFGVRTVVNASSACVDSAPQWPYSVSKRAAELYVDHYRQQHGMRIASLRYPIVFGTGEWYGRVLTRWALAIVKREPLRVFGSGSQTRIFCPIDEAVAFTLNRLDVLHGSTAFVHRTMGVHGYLWRLIDLAAEISTRHDAPIVHDKTGAGEKDDTGHLRLPREMPAMVGISSEDSRLVVPDAFDHLVEWVREEKPHETGFWGEARR